MKHVFIALVSILMVVFMGCGNAQTGTVQRKKWRMVRQVVMTADKTGTSTQERLKDFSQIDYLSFDNAIKLTITSDNESIVYTYNIEDSVLSFRPQHEIQRANDYHQANVYRIVTSTMDSLVLRRIETWGTDSALKITAIFYLIPMENK
jgi:hypothetical protein